MAHHLENFILITLPVENNRERTWQVSSLATRTPHPAALAPPRTRLLPPCALGYMCNLAEQKIRLRTQRVLVSGSGWLPCLLWI